MNKIGKLIKSRIKYMGVPRTKVAELCGVSEGCIRKWETDGLDKAKISNIKKLSKVIDIDMITLLDLQGYDLKTHDEVTLASKIHELDEKDRQAIETIVHSLLNKKGKYMSKVIYDDKVVDIEDVPKGTYYNKAEEIKTKLSDILDINEDIILPMWEYSLKYNFVNDFENLIVNYLNLENSEEMIASTNKYYKVLALETKLMSIEETLLTIDKIHDLEYKDFNILFNKLYDLEKIIKEHEIIFTTYKKGCEQYNG